LPCRWIDGVEIRQIVVRRCAVQEPRLGSCQQRCAFIDLVERVRHQHERLQAGPRAAIWINRGLDEREQRFARAVHRQHHGLRIHGAVPKREPALEPACTRSRSSGIPSASG
jgi:hypothetical protein